MGVFIIEKSDTIVITTGEKKHRCIKTAKFDKFNSSVLGLGDISSPAVRVEGLCAIFDLQGFTDFCRQVDPRLVVPEFLSKFLEWFYSALKKEMVNKIFPEGVDTFCNPPIYTKFMGDGLMCIWDSGDMSEVSKCNIVSTCLAICTLYRSEFYKTIKSDIAYCPSILRCGVAMGDIYTVGNGNDFFGACINLAARLQKVGSLTFCVSRRGFDFKKHLDESYKEDYVTKLAHIRGIGDKELVYVLKSEYEKLDEKDKHLVWDID